MPWSSSSSSYSKKNWEGGGGGDRDGGWNDWKEKGDKWQSGRGGGEAKAGEDSSAAEDTFVLSGNTREDCMKLIGKGGSIKKTLCQESGAKLEVNPEEGTVTMHGSFEAVDKARSMVTFMLLASDSRPDPTDWEDEMYVMVPAENIGRVIGKGGANKQKIESTTWAQVTVPPTPAAGWQAGARARVRISGKHDTVEKARQMVLEAAKIEEKTGKVLPAAPPPAPAPLPPPPAAPGNSLKRKWSEGSGEAEVALTYPFDLFNAIVGRGGDKLKDIQNRTGADLRWQRTDTEFTLRISGTQADVEVAKGLVQSLSGKATVPQQSQDFSLPASAPADVEITLDFGEDAAGVFAASGVNIAHIQTMTGTKVDARRVRSGLEVLIKGHAQKVQSAANMIEALVKMSKEGNSGMWQEPMLSPSVHPAAGATGAVAALANAPYQQSDDHFAVPRSKAPSMPPPLPLRNGGSNPNILSWSV